MDFLSFYWRDVLDIALVTLLLYRILLLILGTRAFSALIGLVVLVAVYAQDLKVVKCHLKSVYLNLVLPRVALW